ncbi:MAG: hypothetical protein QXR96_02545 [Candidatus Woesearchaeota archaeon]
MKVKSYGKILIFGAYSILERGNLGYVATIDKGNITEVKETDSGKIVIDLKNFQISINGIYKNNFFQLEKENDSLVYIKNAINYSFQYLSFKKIKIKNIILTSVNEPEFNIKNQKTGLGSSSCSVVSAVSAILALHDITDRNIVFKISRYAHFKAQNNLGSGYDIAASCFGSHFFISDTLNSNMDFFQYLKKEDNYIKKEFEFPYLLQPILILLKRQVSTKEFIKKVFNFKEKNPKKYESFIFEYNQINNKIKDAFEYNDLKKIKDLLEESWKKRKELGIMAKIDIEKDNETKLINNLKKNGAFTAGIIGAGGDSILALCLSKYDKDKLCNYLDEYSIDFINLNFENKGYEILPK